MTEQTTTTETNSNASATVVLNGARAGIIGIKAGMTQIYNQDGDIVPVTVIDLSPAYVTQVKTKENDGYVAVQLGMLPKKQQNTNKAEKGHFKKSGQPGFRHVTELRVDSVDGITAGAIISADFCKEGDLIDVTGISKGKGFQGGMKRFNFSGNYKTHGASLSHRSLGSIGMRADPGRTFKGRPMPGHMGDEQVTVQNLKVVSIDHENKLMLVKGSIPGGKNMLVIVRKAIKAN